MSDVIIVGDGPAGLSAALFLAKNGQDVTVFGVNKTAMHSAKLYNYLGIPEITGSDFQKVAHAQVQKFGAKIQDQQVTSIEKTAAGFAVSTESGERYESKYLIIAEGKSIKLAQSMGLTITSSGVEVDHNYRSAVDKLYVVGRSTRLTRSQAVISVGTGAVAALDILATEKGKDFVDYDTVD
ncbi:MAG: NAD(P)/FAD-dependent oxidoreductase [Anaerolineales bacterium]|nr:NAD(P)/FAD-dependent oxidoreductase [Anaerolineales bacterium]